MAAHPSSASQLIGWGILGTGNIARAFALDLHHAPAAKLVAIGSRSHERARDFAQQFNVARGYGSYADLVNDPRVQAVYIATPASAHKDNMLLCLRAHKAVLCEKPFTVNAREAQEVIELARRARVFVMEAMWTRFLPLMGLVRELVAAGVIGEVRQLIADSGTEVVSDPRGRVFDRELGGGALLQKGVYLVSLASMILGSPNRVSALGHFGETGVDDHCGILLGYPGGRLASLVCSVRVESPRTATLVGTGGQILIHGPIICPSSLTLRHSPVGNSHPAGGDAVRPGSLKELLVRYGKQNYAIRRMRERYPNWSDRLLYGVRAKKMCAPPTGEGFHYQVGEVIRCLRADRLESDIMPLNESLGIMQTMDRIRERISDDRN